jgi:hypothetical protein
MQFRPEIFGCDIIGVNEMVDADRFSFLNFLNCPVKGISQYAKSFKRDTASHDIRKSNN